MIYCQRAAFMQNFTTASFNADSIMLSSCGLAYAQISSFQVAEFAADRLGLEQGMRSQA